MLAWPGISILVAATLFAAYLPVSTLSPRFQHLHDTVADKQTKVDLHAALRGAGLAERYAVAAVDFALAATDEAEYAALDAILAWADADATHSRRVQA